MNDDERYAREEYDRRLREISRTSPGKAVQGVENSYGQAYQALVRLGRAPQLKKKYRGGL